MERRRTLSAGAKEEKSLKSYVRGLNPGGRWQQTELRADEKSDLERQGKRGNNWTDSD